MKCIVVAAFYWQVIQLIICGHEALMSSQEAMIFFDIVRNLLGLQLPCEGKFYLMLQIS